MTRFARGALSAVAIALIADFIWHVAKAAINTKLAETADPGVATTVEARRRARLRTLCRSSQRAVCRRGRSGGDDGAVALG